MGEGTKQGHPPFTAITKQLWQTEGGDHQRNACANCCCLKGSDERQKGVMTGNKEETRGEKHVSLAADQQGVGSGDHGKSMCLWVADQQGDGSAADLLCLLCVSVGRRLQHTWAHTLVINPIGHGSNHVWQQCGCSMDELAELVYLQLHTLWVVWAAQLNSVNDQDSVMINH